MSTTFFTSSKVQKMPKLEGYLFEMDPFHAGTKNFSDRKDFSGHEGLFRKEKKDRFLCQNFYTFRGNIALTRKPGF